MPGETFGFKTKVLGRCSCGVVVAAEAVVMVTNVLWCPTIMPDGQKVFPMVQVTHIPHVGNTTSPSGMIVWHLCTLVTTTTTFYRHHHPTRAPSRFTEDSAGQAR